MLGRRTKLKLSRYANDCKRIANESSTNLFYNYNAPEAHSEIRSNKVSEGRKALLLCSEIYVLSVKNTETREITKSL